MTRWLKVGLAAALGASATAGAVAMRGEGDAEIVCHTVFFNFKDPSRANIDKCLASSKKYASKHEGVLLYACGERGEDSGRSFVDKDFHVMQTMIFRSREALDKYMQSEDRQKFVGECRSLWSKIRVFEVNLRGMETPGLKRAESN